MAEQETLVVHGYQDLIRSLREMSKQEARQIRGELRTIGQLVQREATALFAPMDDRSASAYRVRVRQRGVAVEQSLRRTTGDHPEFGALQMREALLPALERHEHELVRNLNAMLGRIAQHEGF